MSKRHICNLARRVRLLCGPCTKRTPEPMDGLGLVIQAPQHLYQAAFTRLLSFNGSLVRLGNIGSVPGLRLPFCASSRAMTCWDIGMECSSPAFMRVPGIRIV
jgi:hypothetical protein